MGKFSEADFRYKYIEVLSDALKNIYESSDLFKHPHGPDAKLEALKSASQIIAGAAPDLANSLRREMGLEVEQPKTFVGKTSTKGK